MSWNIFEGAQDTDRYGLIKMLAQSRRVDALCLQEANGWHKGDRPRLEDFAASTGLQHYIFGDSNTDSKLAIFSRRPIVRSTVHKDGFHHCAIEAWLLGEDDTPVKAVVAHLNPFDEAERLKEARYIAEIGKDAVLVGDMNSLSRSDTYPPALLSLLGKLGNARYGTDELRYDVTDHFAANGFVDMAAKLGTHQNTFPAMTGTEAFQFPTRFDYVFVPAWLEAAVQQVRVIKDPLTRHISDHHPLEIEISEAVFSRLLPTSQGSLQLAA